MNGFICLQLELRKRMGLGLMLRFTKKNPNFLTPPTMPWNWKRDFSIRSVGMKSLWILWPDGFVLLRLLTRWKCPGLLKEWDKSVRSLGLQQDKSSRSEGLKGFHPHRPDGNVPLFENTKAWRHGVFPYDSDNESNFQTFSICLFSIIQRAVKS